MKNLGKLFRIIFVATIIACAMASCDLLGGLGGGGGTGGSTPTAPGSGTVTGVSLDKSSVTLLVGGTEVLTATITPSNATNQNLTWTSSNDSAATVSPGGLITAVAAGTAIITVKTQDGDKTASCTVTVNPIPVTSVSLKESTSLIVGGTETLYAVIDPPNASDQNVTWASNNTGVATVSANGTVTAVAAGTATITVKTADGNKTADCVVTVVTSPIAVTSVTLNKSSTSLNAGSSEYLVPTITPSNATNQNLTWTSSNASAATVSPGGLVTAVAPGTATITVKTQDGDKTASCTVTVSAIPVTSVSLKKETSIAIGGTELLSPIILPSNAANQSVTWNSDNKGVATVSARGLVTAVAAGTATITVTTVDGNKTASCSVNVSASANTFNSIADMAAWLSNQTANSATSSYTVKLNVNDLGGSSTTFGSAGKALRDNSDKYVSLDLSDSTFTSIGNEAFYECTSLTGVIIPYSVSSIGQYAFSMCISLANVIIPNSVTSIGQSAFFGCYRFTSVTIPNSTTSIGEAAFSGCHALTAINVAPGSNTYTDDGGVLYNKDKTTLVCYPGGKTGSFTIPSSVTSIGNGAFHYTSLTSVTIPDGVKRIGRTAFTLSMSLTSITIPNSVITIEDYAFSGCDILTSVTFEGTIVPGKLSSEYAFPGDLRAKYLAGGIGTYTRPNTGAGGTWTRQADGGGDPTAWTAIPYGTVNGTTTTFGRETIRAIAYGGGKFVAGGGSSRIAYSSDGISWTAVTKFSGDDNSVNAIAYGSGRFVAGWYLNPKMAYSSDGVDWTDIPAGTGLGTTTFYSSGIKAIAFGNGKFVAGGNGGQMAYSSDGINWIAVTDNKFTNSDIMAIAFGNGRFVTGGYDGKMAYSSDGINWTAVTDSTFGTSDNTIHGIAYGNNRFVAVGGNYGSGKMAYSN